MKPTIEQIPTLSYEELVEQLRLSRINGADYRDISRALNAEMRLRTPSSQYRCFKCGHTACELIQVRTSGGFSAPHSTCRISASQPRSACAASSLSSITASPAAFSRSRIS